MCSIQTYSTDPLWMNSAKANTLYRNTVLDSRVKVKEDWRNLVFINKVEIVLKISHQTLKPKNVTVTGTLKDERQYLSGLGNINQFLSIWDTDLLRSSVQEWKVGLLKHTDKGWEAAIVIIIIIADMSNGMIMAPWAFPPVCLWHRALLCPVWLGSPGAAVPTRMWSDHLSTHIASLFSFSSFVGSSVEWLSILVRKILRLDSWELHPYVPFLGSHRRQVQPQGKGGVRHLTKMSLALWDLLWPKWLSP